MYTLIQLYLNEAKLHEFTQCTIDTLDEYTHILVHLRPKPLERMRKWIRVFRETKTRAP